MAEKAAELTGMGLHQRSCPVEDTVSQQGDLQEFLTRKNVIVGHTKRNGIFERCPDAEWCTRGSNPERRSGNLYLWECNLFPTGNRQRIPGYQKGDSLL